jgi:hypothetical protein
MKQKKTLDLKPKKTWMKKWFSLGISNTLFIWIFEDHINWCLDEDAPYKDTIRIEIDQPWEDYRLNGPPNFVQEISTEIDLEKIFEIINQKFKNT